MLLALLLACPIGSDTTTATRPDRPDDVDDTVTDVEDTAVTDDTAITGDTAATPTDVARWNFLVFMNGDNNLESYVVHDLNELEAVGSGDGVNVIVQADRIDGYDDSDGDWTGARRYYITGDEDDTVVSSPVLAELGEVDMGDPTAVADFLAWASAAYPAEHTVLILWNHGDSWSATASTEPPPPPSISSDDTSGSVISIAGGELDEALAGWVETHDKLDIIGFDACLMASWEVAHSLQEEADWLLGSQISVNWEGYRYAPALDYLRTDVAATPEQLAAQMVNDMVAEGTEWGESAIDLSRIGALSTAIDNLAAVALEDPEASARLLTCRDDARGCYDGWEDWYLDLGDFADKIGSDAVGTPLGDAADVVRAAMDEAVPVVQGAGPYHWITGITIFADTSEARYVRLYQRGSWAEDTRWDDWLLTQVPAE